MSSVIRGKIWEGRCEFGTEEQRTSSKKEYVVNSQLRAFSTQLFGVSRHVQLKHLRRRSFLNLGWSQNIGTYRLNITGMPSDLRQRSSIFPTLEKPHRPKVPPMMRTLSINRIKHHLPKPNDIRQNIMSLYMLKKRVAWQPKERLPMKLTVIKSENIEVYISFDNFIQGNGKRLRMRHRCAHCFKRQDVTKHPVT